MDKLFLQSLFLISFAMLPVYQGSSGGMQVSHILLSLFIVVNLFLHGISREDWSYIFMGLIAFVLVMEMLHFITGGNQKSLLHPVYLIYNFFLLNALVGYFGNDKSKIDFFHYGIFASTVVAIIGVLVFGYSIRVGSEFGRAVGTFNNPNQLGYFSVCLSSVACLFFRVREYRPLILLIILIAAFFLSIVSLSKAAMVSVFVCFIVVFLPRKGNLTVSLGLLLIVIIPVAVYIYTGIDMDSDKFKFASRLQDIGQANDDNLAERGYFAIMEANWYQLLLGLGSEKVNDIVGHEVHSTVFSFLNNYGVIGFLLFSSVIFVWFSKVFRVFGLSAILIVCVPPMLYGITHNGSRFTFFWVLIGVSFVIAKESLHKQIK